MPNTWGFGSDSTGFSDTVTEDIKKGVVKTLRAGLIALPRGAVVPAQVTSMQGKNFTLTYTGYPDVAEGQATNPLTEGVAPSPTKLGIDTQSITVAQFGQFTQVTDIARMQSPHDLFAIAKDKVRRMAVEEIDRLARVALATVASSNDTFSSLNTSDLLDAKATMAALNIEPIPGVGYYALLHPYALRGLENESDLNGWVDVTAQAGNGDITTGAVSRYRNITFIASPKFTATDGVYPVYFLGAASLFAGDVGTLSYHVVTAPSEGNELNQLASAGVKGIFGAAPVALSEQTDGAGTNAAAVTRVYRIGVADGRSGVEA